MNEVLAQWWAFFSFAPNIGHLLFCKALKNFIEEQLGGQV